MVHHNSHEEAGPKNAFQNDGSFLEMFKRMQESSPSSSAASAPVAAASASTAKSAVVPTKGDEPDESRTVEGNAASAAPPKRLPMFGKRRGGRTLPTGKVKKVKLEKKEVEAEKPKDAWAHYLAEVKKYKETTCEEEGKTRPLVK